MQQHLTALEQTGLMRDLNQAVQLELDSAHYATMVAVGFHGRRGLLVVTNAGHPPPFWYRAKKDEWAWLERQQPTQSAAVSGTPLGLLPDIAYDRMVVKPTADDLVVLYSDGVSEAQNPDGEELGRDGLMALARQLDSSSPEAFGTQLAEAVRGFRGGTVPQDDETIIIMQTTPRPSTGSDSS
jgi:sigma-B regulation protein RsbU (phosphoserine phosphatase)